MTDLPNQRTLQLSRQDREGLLADHPVVKRNYIVRTQAINATYNLFRERVWTRRTGTVLHARPRVGKTSCAKVVRLLLQEEFPQIHQIFLSADDGAANRSSGIVTDILDAEGLTIPSRLSLQQNRIRLITHIETCVAARAGDQLVLVVDEMQQLVEADLRQLLVIHNRLQERGITMTTLGFAQPEIENLQTSLAATHAYNLIARFLAEPIRFEGCANLADYEMILEAYDEKKFYPIDSDWTYTRFFLPEAYRSGFRLKSHAKRTWEKISTAARKLGSASIPMDYLTRVIEFILVKSRDEDSDSFLLNDERVDDAISSSNLTLFASIMGAKK